MTPPWYRRPRREGGLWAAAEAAEERSDEAGSAAPPPDSEVEAKPKRRKFTGAYRLRIPEEADPLAEAGRDRPAPAPGEAVQLEAKLARLEAEFEKAHTILDVQEKVSGLLGFSLERGKDS